MKKKSSNFITAFLVLILLVGLSLLLYPSVSDYWNSLHQSRAIATYAEEVANLDTDKYAELWNAAAEYNASLLDRANNYLLSDAQKETYQQLLNVSGTGVMGYIEIPVIQCSLPLYHGTDEGVLQIAVGHLDWTSLPVGGESTHCVLSGHRGLPSAKLFTNLDKLVVGDGAALCAGYLNDAGIPCRMAEESHRMQSAVGAALCAEEMAARGETVTAQGLEPVYLRLSQAERERLARGLKITLG